MILVENTLAGVAGLAVTTGRLAESAQVGTVTARTISGRAQYDTVHTVHGLPTVRVDSGGHRGETPHLRVSLPSSGPWSARWYTWVPRLQDAGFGTGEVRSMMVLPDVAWVVHATAAGNVGTRGQPPGLASAAIGWDIESGSAVPIGQWVRVEVRYDGTDLESRVYPGHAPDRHRGNTWLSLPEPGRTLDLTGYRWQRNRPLIQWGSSGTEVRAFQHELVDLGYSLGAGGANGDFDERMHLLVHDVQRDLGVTPVDGSAGPETRSAVDLALGRVPDPLWLSHLAVSDGGWIGPAEAPPEPPEVTRWGFTVGMPI